MNKKDVKTETSPKNPELKKVKAKIMRRAQSIQRNNQNTRSNSKKSPESVEGFARRHFQKR